MWGDGSSCGGSLSVHCKIISPCSSLLLVQHLNQVLDPEQSLLSARLVHCQGNVSCLLRHTQFHPNQIHKCFFKPKTMFLIIWAVRIRRWPRPGSLNDTVGFPVEIKRGHDERDGEILFGTARWILGSTISHGIVAQWIGRLEKWWLPLKSNQSFWSASVRIFPLHESRRVHDCWRVSVRLGGGVRIPTRSFPFSYVFEDKNEVAFHRSSWSTYPSTLLNKRHWNLLLHFKQILGKSID